MERKEGGPGKGRVRRMCHWKRALLQMKLSNEERKNKEERRRRW